MGDSVFLRTSDAKWMQIACELALRGEGLTHPNPPVGAIVVRQGKVVGSGYHHRAGKAHAEVLALGAAGGRARGATLYVTLEPCSTQGRTGPCTEAIRAAGIARVVVGVRDPNPRHAGRGLALLRNSDIGVVEGVGEAHCRAIISPFRKWVTQHQPYLTLKMGMTLDGKIADRNGHSKWITGTRARQMVKTLRRRADAVLVGSGTVATDDPGLLCTGRPGLLRVIVSSDGRLPEGARVLTDDRRGQTIVAVSRRCSNERIGFMKRCGVQVIVLPLQGGRVSLKALCRRLGKLGVVHVLCEGGGQLANALVGLGMIDEYYFFVAPCLMGAPGALDVLHGSNWSLAQAPELRFMESSRVGADILVRAIPRSARAEWIRGNM